MGIENIKAFLANIDLNKNNIIEQSEIDFSQKANPTISLNGVTAGMFIGNSMDGLQLERTGTEQADRRSSVLKKEEYAPYYGTSNIEKVNNFEELPTGSHKDIKDARNFDISSLTLSREQLLNLCIDETTVLSDEQKKIIDEYKEKMKAPGLGIKHLHEQGFTGKGVKIAIIDQPLGEHQEYSSNLRHLEDINSKEMDWTNAEMHGASVASIAVGKTTGVAPDSDLLYFSAVNITRDPQVISKYKESIQSQINANKENRNLVNFLKEKLEFVEGREWVLDNTPYATAINKVLDMNKTLPDNEKTTVISISWGFDKDAPGYDKLLESISRAKKEGVFVVSTALENHYGMYLGGANRNPQADPENPNSYEAGAFWKEISEKQVELNPDITNKLLLVPMDHRTIADYKSKDGYRYEGNDGGMSWAVPWIAGMYALAKQADSTITPEQFWQKAIETSDDCKNNDTNTCIGRIINPKKLINSIKQ